MAGILAERARMGATASSIRSFTSAICAVEDPQWIPPAATAFHKRIAAGAASAGPQPYLPPAGLVILVENASKSRYGPLLGALATLAWVCFLRIGEMAIVRVADIALPGSIQFWNSKTGEEGYTNRPLSKYTDQVQQWAYGFVVAAGKQDDTPPPPPCISYAQATAGVGTVIIVYIILVAYQM